MLSIGSLFSGIGGLEKGLEQGGLGPVVWQFETDKSACIILEKYWPAARRLGDIRSFTDHDLESVDIIAGGDPCQCRTRAKGGRKSKYPDLAGYFLAVVGGCRPRWVVRENVPASDTVDFKAALECMGYGAVIVQYDGADFTSQSRVRHFVIGCSGRSGADLERQLVNEKGACRDNKAVGKTWETLAFTITSHPYRYAEGDNLLYEDTERKIRLLSAEERERLQGFPAGWTAGLSFYRRCLLIGNAVMPPVAKAIGEMIKEFELSA